MHSRSGYCQERFRNNEGFRRKVISVRSQLDNMGIIKKKCPFCSTSVSCGDHSCRECRLPLRLIDDYPNFSKSRKYCIVFLAK